jgi:hypothetical protein
MSFVPSERFLLELIADLPLPAITVLQRHTAPPVAVTGDIEWQISLVGEATLERLENAVH